MQIQSTSADADLQLDFEFYAVIVNIRRHTAVHEYPNLIPHLCEEFVYYAGCFEQGDNKEH